MSKTWKLLGAIFLGVTFYFVLGMFSGASAYENVLNGDTLVNGGVTVRGDLYADHNNLFFNPVGYSGVNPTIDFKTGDSMIKEMGDLYILSDDYVHIGPSVYASPLGRVLIQDPLEIAARARTASGWLEAGTLETTDLLVKNNASVGGMFVANGSLTFGPSTTADFTNATITGFGTGGMTLAGDLDMDGYDIENVGTLDVDGTAYFQSNIDVDGTADFDSNIVVSGTSDLQGNIFDSTGAVSINDDATVNGTLIVYDATTINGTLYTENVYPISDGTYDLGNGSYRFNELYLDGTGGTYVGDYNSGNYMAYDNSGVNSYGSYWTYIDSDNSVQIQPSDNVYLYPGSGNTFSYNILPNTPGGYHLGDTGYAWDYGVFEDLYATNSLNVSNGNFTVDFFGNTYAAGTLHVDNQATFDGNVDANNGLDVTGADLNVIGVSNLNVDGGYYSGGATIFNNGDIATRARGYFDSELYIGDPLSPKFIDIYPNSIFATGADLTLDGTGSIYLNGTNDLYLFPDSAQTHSYSIVPDGTGYYLGDATHIWDSATIANLYATNSVDVYGGFGSGGTSIGGLGVWTEQGLVAADLANSTITGMVSFGGAGYLGSFTFPGLTGADLHINDLFGGNVIIGTGQTTIRGNVDALNGLDVTGADLTVGGTMHLASGSITDTTGLISFGSDDLATLGDLTAGTTNLGTLTVDGGSDFQGSIYNSSLNWGGSLEIYDSLDVYGGMMTVDTSGNVYSAGNIHADGTLSSGLTITINGTSGTIGGVPADTIYSTRGLTINSDTTNTLTLDSGTTGDIVIGASGIAKNIYVRTGTGGVINLGNNAKNKTINIGASTSSASDTIRIATDGVNPDTITIGNANAGTTVGLTGGTAWLISPTGAASFNGLVSANLGLNVTGADFTVGGGYGGTGATIYNATGNISSDGNIHADGTLSSGATITINGSAGTIGGVPTDTIYSSRSMTIDTATGVNQLNLNTVNDRAIVIGSGPFTQQAAGGQVTFSGNVDATNGLDVTVAALTAAAGFTVSGGTVDIQPNITDSLGDVTVGDNFVVTGTSDLQGDVSDSLGAFTIADSLSQTGAGQVTFSGNVDATNGLDVTVANLTVGGANFFVAPATGNVTSLGTIQGATLTDGTFSVTGGAVSGATGNVTLWTNNANYIALTNLSSTATGLTYTNTTGVFSLTAGYVIPTTTEETNWNAAYSHKTTEDALSGLVKVNGAGIYSAITDNSTNWDAAYSAVTGATGITSTGAVDFSGATSMRIPVGPGLAAAGNCAAAADRGKIYYAATTAGAMSIGKIYVCATTDDINYSWSLLN